MVSESQTESDIDASPTVALLGATPGTGNMGVDALAAATVQGLLEFYPKIKIYMQSWVDEGPISIRVGGESHHCEPLVVRRRQRRWRRNGVSQIRAMAKGRTRIGKLVARGQASFSTTWKKLNRCDAILDISAGDSFTDIYGEDVFWYQSQIKLMCLDLGIPLVLMPQTFGPFEKESSRAIAAEIISRSCLVCTREANGADEIRNLCAGRPNPNVVEAPDVAFLLGDAKTPLPVGMERHLSRGQGPVIAINVSGLLYFKKQAFDLATTHSDLAMRLMDWALAQENSRVLLVPHVVPGDAKNLSPLDLNDTRASQDLLSRLDSTKRERVDLLEGANSPARAKHAMGKCDFFVGARMHAFIGAASQGVPGVLLAYSKKAAGTTGLVGLEDAVVDLRSAEPAQAIAVVDAKFRARAAAREHLACLLPNVQQRIRRFFGEDISSVLGGLKGGHELACNESLPPALANTMQS